MFSKLQQKEHRLQLARHLSRNVKDKNYNHNKFSNCALGYAARIGIGGLVDKNHPKLPSSSCFLYEDANTVFGDGAYCNIFAGSRRYNRKEVIEVLRNFKD